MTGHVHELKTWPGPFERILSGEKTAEFRRDDRGFDVGDLLKLREWSPSTKTHTGRELTRLVTDICEASEGFGIPEGYVMMSIRPVTAKDLE